MTEEQKLNRAIGQAVLELRNKNHWTQLQLSAMSGIEEAHLSRVENGLTGVMLGTVLRLSAAFNVKPGELITRVCEIKEEAE